MPGFAANYDQDGTSRDSRAEYRRKYRWRFTAGFLNPTEYLYAKVSSRPKVKVDQVKMCNGQETIFLAGRHIWESITIEFCDVESPNISNRIYKWLSGQLFENLSDNVILRDPGKYKVDIQLEMTDNSGKPNETWKLYGAWPQNVDWGALSYESNEIADIKVTLSFDKAEMVDEGFVG